MLPKPAVPPIVAANPLKKAKPRVVALGFGASGITANHSGKSQERRKTNITEGESSVNA